MNENKLCPNCGATVTNNQQCEYCGTSLSNDIDNVAPSNTYDNPILERILGKAIDSQKTNDTIILDVMEYFGGFHGYCIQVLVYKDKLRVCFILEKPEHIKRFSASKINRLFEPNSAYQYFYNGYFARENKPVANIITQIFAEVYDVNITSLGYHIWSRYKTSKYQDEYFDEKGNPMPAKPLQASIRWFSGQKLHGWQIILITIGIMLGIILLLLLTDSF